MTLAPVSLRGYRRVWLARDVVAGSVLAAVAIPEVMGYTSISQTPIQTGLYTVIFPTMVFALLASSRLLVVGADSATAAVLAAGLGGLSVAGLTPESDLWVAYCSLAALICAALLLLARILKLGFIGDFLSTSVLVGFLTGVGIQVFSGQIPEMLGVPKGSGNWFAQQLAWIREIPNAHWLTFGFAAFTVACVVGFERFLPRVPGALVAVVVCIAVSAAIDAQAQGVDVVGSVPSGFPPIGLPDLGLYDAWLVLPTALSCFVLIVAQSAATSRSFAARHGEKVDVNQDILGLSGAQVAAGVTGTFVVNGSPTKTQILDGQGGKSQIANLTMAAIVLLFTLFLTGLLADMPKATLAGIVFMIGVSLVDVAGMRRIARERFSEFVVALLTAVTVFAVGVEQGIVLAVVASVIEIVRRAYAPQAFVIGSRHGDEEPTFQPASPGHESRPGLIVFRFDAPLFYANASRFTDDVKAVVEGAPHPVTWAIVLSQALDDIDYSAGVQIHDLAVYLKSRGITLAFTDLAPEQKKALTAYGVLDPDLQVRTFDSRAEAIAAFEADVDPTGARR
jgi:MFS superfamily sulfate permease-like transporter